MEDSTPIFSKQKMQFTPSDKITHLAVANDILVLAMANNTLFRINLKQPDKNEGIVNILHMHFMSAESFVYNITFIFESPLFLICAYIAHFYNKICFIFNIFISIFMYMFIYYI